MEEIAKRENNYSDNNTDYLIGFSYVAG